MPNLYTNLNNRTGLQNLAEWEAPERYWSPKTRGWYVTYSLFFISLVFIAALLAEYIFIVTIIAFAFLWFVQASIPPRNTKYSITTLGIRAQDSLFQWKNIKHFWFSQKDDVIFLYIEYNEDEAPDVFKRVGLILTTVDTKEIFRILIGYIGYGNEKDITYNFLSYLVGGKYIDITTFEEPIDSDSLQ